MAEANRENSVFFDLVDPLHMELLHDLTNSNLHGIPIDRSPGDYWIAYGSEVLNALRPESDIDIMYVSTAVPDVALRKDGEHKGRPVSIYVVGQKSIDSDGRDYNFGGYFAGKLLSPHVVIHDNSERTALAAKVAQSTVGEFLGNFIDFTRLSEADRQMVASEAIKSYLRICPWYKAYLIKFFAAAYNMDTIADRLEEHYAVSLSEAGQIARAGEHYIVPPDRTEGKARNVEENIIKAIARFWSFGAIEHGNDHRFGDYYFNKADEAIERLDPDSSLWPKIVKRFSLGG